MHDGRRQDASGDAGFSLIEVLVAMSLLIIGVVALEGVIAFGARQLTASQDQLIAGQRAAEAIESVFKARDNRVLTWAQIRPPVTRTPGPGTTTGVRPAPIA